MRTVLASMPVSSRSSRVAVCIGDSLCSRLPPKSCHSPFLPRPAIQPFVLMRKKPAPVKWVNGCVVGASPGCASRTAGPSRRFAATGGSASVALSFSRVGCLWLCVSSARLVGVVASCSQPACLRVVCASSRRRREYVCRRSSARRRSGRIYVRCDVAWVGGLGFAFCAFGVVACVM